ncbi:MAG: UvrD-helicase domain-containing protein, partial [Candidatus Latescibacteria bacterium]|nr:UvrD-helicase domain-containing protein [Candidatus Latescibacterota bacterium]
EQYLTMLTDFHSLCPGDDNLRPVLQTLTGTLPHIIKMCESGSVDIESVNNCIVNIKASTRKGSPDRWLSRGISLGSVRKGLKECVKVLEVLESFCRNERGMTAHAASRLMSEFELLERYFLDLKKNRSRLDHDDTLIETWRLLRKNVSVRQEVSRSYRHILVDEFQDTDSIQIDILRMIAGNSNAALFTVGDPKQSIYRFRGAGVTIFNSFMARTSVDFKTLSKNYRSTPAIIGFTNHVFSRIMGGDDPEHIFEARYSEMKPHRRDNPSAVGVEVVVFESGNADERRMNEAKFIAERARELKDTHGYSFGEMALILRKGTRVRAYEEAFLAHAVPYVSLTGGDPFRSPEAHDIANMLGWLCEPNNPVFFSALFMSPFFNIKPESLHGICRIAGSAAEMPKAFLNDEKHIGYPWCEGANSDRVREILKSLLSLRDRATIRDILEYAFDRTGYTLTLLADPVTGELSLATIDHILESADMFESNGGNIREFTRLLSRGMLSSERTPFVETKDDSLTILTIHKAKGMEYKVVFLADITGSTRRETKPLVFDSELGIGFDIRNACGNKTRTLPGNLAGEEEKLKEVAENKRLFYVGCTRAENHLVISGGKPSKDPDTMFESSNWMGWLHAALDISPDGDMESECPEELFIYRRISEPETPSHDLPSERWENILERSEDTVPAKVPEITSLIAPIADIPHTSKPEHLSPTQVMDYSECPALYLFRHVYGLKGTYSGKSGGGYGEQYGSFAHSVLEKFKVQDLKFKNIDSLAMNHGQKTTDNHDQLSLLDEIAGKDIPDEWKRKLKEELLSFINSPLYREISCADEIRREEPFAFVHDDVLIRGAMDLLYRKGEDITIVDYKTDSIDAGDIAAASGRYRLQLGIYGIAVNRAEYRIPSKMIIHFLTPGVSHTINCTGEFLEDISSAISQVIESMTAGNFSPKENERCERCSFAELCGR